MPMPFCVIEEKLDILILVKEDLTKHMICPTNENFKLGFVIYVFTTQKS